MLLSNGYKSDLGVVCLEILEMSGINNGIVASYRKVTEIGAAREVSSRTFGSPVECETRQGICTVDLVIRQCFYRAVHSLEVPTTAVYM